VFGRSILPDLRRATPATHTLFKSIVLEGIYAPKGMARFDDVLSGADTEALHDYVIDQAWQSKNTPAPASAQTVATKP
jgi:quinohemoprotein ethanol dehydrogenase